MLLRHIRRIYTETGQWPQQLSRDIVEKVESKWKSIAASCEGIEVSQSDGEKAYILAMFPYPSGNLHMGHVRVYTISDVMARYNKLKGHAVLHPMGWDAFGLPAENAAKERQLKPSEWTSRNIDVMKQQLDALCLTLDWSRHFSTADPSYYKWTQWLFLQLFKNGLAYQRIARVFWDPIDQTVLAAEQVNEQGRSWRSGAKVEYKYLKQWYFRTTAYAKRLKDNLNSLNPVFWREVIDLQRGWIGECDGCRIEFPIVSITSSTDSVPDERLSVFTKTPELLFGASHIALPHDHFFASLKDQVVAVNPLSKKQLPLVLMPPEEKFLGDGARLGIPSLGLEIDAKIASDLNLQYESVLSNDNSTVINSGPILSGKSREEAFNIACELLRKNGFGGHRTSSKLDDWLVSRQRYWGTPIPIIHCPTCGPQPVDEADLPVVLQAEASDEEEYCDCPKCGSSLAKRDSDTLDTFVDSSWYFLRFIDPKNSELIFDTKTVSQWMPVDLYIGGREHAIMHLYFARFVCYFLHDLGLLHCKEPFKKLLTQGMVYGRTFKDGKTSKYLKPDEVEEIRSNKFVSKLSKEPVITSWEKMSKSKYNGVDPQEVLSKYGVDSVRTCVVANVAPKSTRKWSEDQFIGVVNWQRRLWTLMGDFLKHSLEKQDVNLRDLADQEAVIREARNYFVKEASFHLEVTYLLNTAISRLQGLTTSLRKVPHKSFAHSKEFRRAFADLIVMISPFMPCLSLELWQTFVTFSREHSLSLTNRNFDIPLIRQPWPCLDPDYKMAVVIQVDSTEIGALPIKFCDLDKLSAEDALKLVLNSDFVKTPEMLEAAGIQFSTDKFSYLYERNYRGVINFPKVSS